jgi:hypothetical protein
VDRLSLPRIYRASPLRYFHSSSAQPQELAEDIIDSVRPYLK